MGEPTINVISEEELKEKLALIYEELKSGATIRALHEKYGIKEYVISDLKGMTELEVDNFIEKIPDIKKDIQSGKKISKIAIDFPCTSKTITFVGKQLFDNYGEMGKTKAKEENKKIYKKAEEMWKKYRAGVSLEDIAFLYNQGLVDDTRFTLDNFQKLLNDEKNIDMEDIEARKRSISSKYGFDSDTIDYILSGNKQTDVISIEECVEKLNSLYRDITIEAKPFYYLQDNYQVTPYIVSELRRMPKEKFDKFLEKIPYIKDIINENPNEKTIIHKVGVEIGYPGRLVSYVAKNICEEYVNSKNKTGINNSKRTKESKEIALEEP